MKSMTLVQGGSWNGSSREGYPPNKRKLVLAKKDADGQFEVYIRERPGCPWIFAHEGTTSEADGPWSFEEDG